MLSIVQALQLQALQEVHLHQEHQGALLHQERQVDFPFILTLTLQSVNDSGF